MDASGTATRTASPSRARTGPLREASAVVLCAIVLCVALAIAQGPSWSWDRAHYHVYAAHQWLEGLLGRGYLPGGHQSYLNPLAYVPGALLERAGWSPRSVAVMVAAFQSACVWAVYAIARDLTRSRAAAAASAVIALFTPLYVSQLGTSYIDATTTVFLLAGVWACRRAGDRDRRPARWAAVGGLAMGVAIGLKLSHAIPAVIAPILFFAAGGPSVVGTMRRVSRALVAYGAAAATGLAIAHGAWGADLYRITGNPFHPLLGSVFARAVPHEAAAPAEPAAVVAEPTMPAIEPDGSAASAPAALDRILGMVRASGSRFVPESIGDALRLPLRIADPRIDAPLVYVEWRAPDPRLLLLGVLLLAGGLAVAVRVLRSRSDTGAARVGTTPRPDGPLLAFLALWYVAWLLSSTNGRYAIGLLMLCAIPLVQTAIWWLGSGRAAAWLIGSTMALQAFCSVLAQHPADRHVEIDWERAALVADLPEVMRDRPTLHLLTTTFSWSYLLPRMHPDSTFANVFEGCAGDPCDPALEKVLARWQGRLRTLVQVDEIRDGRPSIGAGWTALQNARLARVDLRIDRAACEYFEVTPILLDLKLMESTESGTTVRRSSWVASCPLLPAPGAAAVHRAAATRHDALFALLERACPRELGSAASGTEWSGGGRWLRRYPSREIDIVVTSERVVARHVLRGSRVVGEPGALAAGSQSIDCETVAARRGPPTELPLSLDR